MSSKLEPYREEIIELRKKQKTYPQIVDHLAKKYQINVNRKTVNDFYLKTQQINDTFSETLEENMFADAEWSHGWLKTKEASIFIRNNKGIITFDEMREKFIEEMKSYSPVYKTIKRDKIKESHLQVIDPADVHVNKLAISQETGDIYNPDIARKRVLEAVEGLLSKGQGYKLDKILFIVGNDVLHTDNLLNTTTKGTPQDTSTKWYEAFQIAKAMYIEAIEILMTVADVHVVHNPSNHDFLTGYFLADSLSSWFRQSENVSFDTRHRHRKYFQYGTNLIGTSHGDKFKMADAPLLMANEAPKMWADTVYRYFYLHHIHHKQVNKFFAGKDYPGVTVEHLRSPSGTDAYHYEHGYCHNKKAIESYIHSKNEGQVARLTHLF